MAADLGRLVVHFDMNTRGVEMGAARVQRAVDDVAKDAEKSLGSMISNVSGALIGVGSSLTLGVTLPLAQFAKSSTDAFREFDRSIVGVNKTVVATETQIDDLSDSIREFSRDSGVAAAEIAGLAQIGGQLGKSVEEVDELAIAAAKLGVSTDLSADQAMTAMSRISEIIVGANSDVIDSTKGSTEVFHALSNQLVHLGNTLPATESQIANTAIRMAGLAQITSVAQEDILGLAAASNAVGLFPEAGGSAILRTFQQLQVVVSEAGEELEILGELTNMTGGQFAKSFKDDATGAFVSFIKGLRTAAQAGQDTTTVLRDIGLSNVRTSMLVNNLAGNVQILEKSLRNATDAARDQVALDAEFGKFIASADQQFKMFEATVEDLRIEIGEAFAPVLLMLANGMRSLIENAIMPAVEAFNRAPTAVKILGGALVGLLAAIPPLILALGALGKAMIGLHAIKAILGVSSLSLGKIFVAGKFAVAIYAASLKSLVAGLTASGGALAALMGPLGIAAAAIGAGYLAWRAYQRSQQDAAAGMFDASNAAKEMAEKMGIALEGTESLAIRVAKAAKEAGEESAAAAAQSAFENSKAVLQLRELVRLGEELPRSAALQMAVQMVVKGADVDEAVEAAQKLLDQAVPELGIKLTTDDMNYEEFIGGFTDMVYAAENAIALGANAADVYRDALGKVGTGLGSLAGDDHIAAIQAMQAVEDSVRSAVGVFEDESIADAIRRFSSEEFFDPAAVEKLRAFEDAFKRFVADFEDASGMDFNLNLAAFSDMTTLMEHAREKGVTPLVRVLEEGIGGTVMSVLEELFRRISEGISTVDESGKTWGRFASSMVRAVSVAREMDDATLTAGNSLQDLADALHESKGSLDIYTQSGRDAKDAFIESAKAVADMIQAAETTGGIVAAVEVYNEYVGAMVATMKQAGMTQEAIDALLEAYGLMPSVIETEINLRVIGLNEALAALVALEGLGQGDSMGSHVRRLIEEAKGLMVGTSAVSSGGGTAYKPSPKSGSGSTAGAAGTFVPWIDPEQFNKMPRDLGRIIKEMAEAQEMLSKALATGSSREVEAAIADIRSLEGEWSDLKSQFDEAARRADLVANVSLATQQKALAKTAEEVDSANRSYVEATRALAEFDEAAAEAAAATELLARVAKAEAEARRLSNKEAMDFESKTVRGKIESLERQLEAEEEYTDRWVELTRQRMALIEEEGQLFRTEVEERLELLRSSVDDAQSILNREYTALRRALDRKADAERRYRDGVVAAEDRFRERRVQLSDEATKAIGDAENKRRDQLKAAALGDLASSEVSARTMILSLRKQTEELLLWESRLKKLRERGLSEAAVSALGLDDPTNQAAVRRMSRANNREITAINEEIAKQNKVADDIVGRERVDSTSALAQELLTIQEAYADDMATLAVEAAQEMTRLSGELVAALNEAREELENAGKSQGQLYAEALAEGIASGLPWINEQVDAVVAALKGLGEAEASVAANTVASQQGNLSLNAQGFVIGSTAGDAGFLSSVDLALERISAIVSGRGLEWDFSRMWDAAWASINAGSFAGVREEANTEAYVGSGRFEPSFGAGLYDGLFGGTTNNYGTTNNAISIYMPPGSNGDDVVRALREWQRRNGPIPVQVQNQ